MFPFLKNIIGSNKLRRKTKVIYSYYAQTQYVLLIKKKEEIKKYCLESRDQFLCKQNTHHLTESCSCLPFVVLLMGKKWWLNKRDSRSKRVASVSDNQ